ncbi:MAG: carboxymuconolactone decarboxylase family protein [Pseudomonadota bacterium]|nr:carboxymuconolactone decarboxylase family protein [Pseudomonadota bacterium]
MPLIPIHTKATAPEKSKPLLEAVEKKYGMIPNILAEMAEAPNVLKAYMEMAGNVAAGSLSPLEVQVVQITTARLNACQYCVAAHSAMSEKIIPSAILEALKTGVPTSDRKLEALRNFTQAIVRKQGWADEADVQAFVDAGYAKAQIAEVVLAIAQKMFSNYFNHIVGTPVDQAFQAHVVQGLKKAG